MINKKSKQPAWLIPKKVGKLKPMSTRNVVKRHLKEWNSDATKTHESEAATDSMDTALDFIDKKGLASEYIDYSKRQWTKKTGQKWKGEYADD